MTGLLIVELPPEVLSDSAERMRAVRSVGYSSRGDVLDRFSRLDLVLGA